MEERNDLKNNEMIANFMGLEGQHEEWCGNNILVDDEYSDTGKTMIPYTPESNWSQLMPVVERIEKMRCDVFIGTNLIVIRSIEDRMSLKVISKVIHKGPKINNVYRAVIEFIRWHNTNQSK